MARYQASEREARYRASRRRGLAPVVTEGDSWFSYELYLNLMDRIDDTKRFALKRLESSGDTITNMVGYAGDARGIKALKVVVRSERPALFLFSGGGNDIVGPELRGAFQPYNPGLPPEVYLDTPAWQTLTQWLWRGYETLITEIGPLCPIFAHGYDHFVPSNRPVRIFPGVRGPGPWVWTEMTKRHVGITDPQLQRDIGRAMIDYFNDEILARLEQQYAGLFAHVDLRGTLDPSVDWQNEIHPTRDGFRRLSERFLEGVEQKLPGLRLARVHRLGGTIA